MIIVIVSPVIKKIIDAFSNEKDCYLIKSKGARGFFYVDSDESVAIVLNRMKQIIASKVGKFYIFELYTVFNGMIDLFAYLPLETKNEHKYYNGLVKDITDEEIENWKQLNLR